MSRIKTGLLKPDWSAVSQGSNYRGADDFVRLHGKRARRKAVMHVDRAGFGTLGRGDLHAERSNRGLGNLQEHVRMPDQLTGHNRHAWQVRSSTARKLKS